MKIDIFCRFVNSNIRRIWSDKANVTMFNISRPSNATHICVSNPIIIGSDNGLSPERRQAIIWTNAGVLLIRLLRKNSVKF